MPATDRFGVGVYNQIAATIGYAWDEGDVGVGPSFSIYSMPACSVRWCGRVVGVAPGAHGQANLYFLGPLGVSLGVNVDWIGGASLVLPGGVAAMVVLGPVLRWRSA